MWNLCQGDHSPLWIDRVGQIYYNNGLYTSHKEFCEDVLNMTDTEAEALGYVRVDFNEKNYDCLHFLTSNQISALERIGIPIE